MDVMKHAINPPQSFQTPEHGLILWSEVFSVVRQSSQTMGNHKEKPIPKKKGTMMRKALIYYVVAFAAYYGAMILKAAVLG